MAVSAIDLPTFKENMNKAFRIEDCMTQISTACRTTERCSGWLQTIEPCTATSIVADEEAEASNGTVAAVVACTLRLYWSTEAHFGNLPAEISLVFYL